MRSLSILSETKICVDTVARQEVSLGTTHAKNLTLELNEDRLYHWLILDSDTVVRDDLESSINRVKALREMIKSERPE